MPGDAGMASAEPVDRRGRAASRLAVLPEEAAGAERDVAAAGQVQADVLVRRPFEPGGLADRVIDRRVEHDHPRPAAARPVGAEQVALDGQAGLGLVADELADDPVGPVFLEHLEGVAGPRRRGSRRGTPASCRDQLGAAGLPRLAAS